MDTGIAADLLLSPADAANPDVIRSAALAECGLPADANVYVSVTKRSVDARMRRPMVRLRVTVLPSAPPTSQPLSSFQDADPRKRVLIVGAGPAGYFAGLELLRSGITPIILDRGKDVQSRRRDLRLLQQQGVVNPHSNYCFGEGGAGTYSDGKLYTRSKKRGNVRDVLELLVAHGAHSDIVIDAHPHVGSNKLWNVVRNIRYTIERHSGEVHFGEFVTALTIGGSQRRACGVRTNNGKEYSAEAVIVATGHSARDTWAMLRRYGVILVEKPFALGVRIEHPQALIDEMMYRQSSRDAFLPAASYALTCQINHRGVFSFCMCPGGIIVPASTSPGEIVVNGMSMSRRDSRFANSGLVVEVNGGLNMQQMVEKAAFQAVVGQTQRAPAQRVSDFVQNIVSKSLPDTSYIPGLETADLREILPSEVSERLAQALQVFNTKMNGYITNDAVMVATESRTSSPVRIPRDPASLESVSLPGLYPCGEGAGYAGGIMSAALDGQRVAQTIAARTFSAA